MIKYVTSLFNLCCKSMVQVSRVAFAVSKTNFRVAAEETRILAILVHDDLVQILAAFQNAFPFWPVPHNSVDKILIVKLDRVGDMVNTTPVFDAIRAICPRARLDIVGHPTSLSLLEDDQRVAERIPYKSWLYHALPVLLPGINSWMIVLRLLRRRYPVVVYLRGSFPLLLLGITSRLGAAKFIPGEPVIERYLKPIESLWGPLPKRDPRLHLSDDNVRFARRLLFGRDAHEGPRIAIHAAAVTASKMWPVERFAAVADDLCRIFGAQVHCFGSQEDKLILHRIFRHSIYSHRFHSTLSLPQVAAAISLCDLFIGNDSGLSHMAAAVGTPIIVLWGPANLNMARPKAPPDRCMILYHDVPCRVFCPEIRCINPIELECVKKIQPDDVLEAAKGFLTKSRRSPARCVS